MGSLKVHSRTIGKYHRRSNRDEPSNISKLKKKEQGDLIMQVCDAKNIRKRRTHGKDGDSLFQKSNRMYLMVLCSFPIWNERKPVSSILKQYFYNWSFKPKYNLSFYINPYRKITPTLGQWREKKLRKRNWWTMWN